MGTADIETTLNSGDLMSYKIINNVNEAKKEQKIPSILKKPRSFEKVENAKKNVSFGELVISYGFVNNTQKLRKLDGMPKQVSNVFNYSKLIVLNNLINKNQEMPLNRLDIPEHNTGEHPIKTMLEVLYTTNTLKQEIYKEYLATKTKKQHIKAAKQLTTIAKNNVLLSTQSKNISLQKLWQVLNNNRINISTDTLLFKNIEKISGTYALDQLLDYIELKRKSSPVSNFFSGYDKLGAAKTLLKSLIEGTSRFSDDHAVALNDGKLAKIFQECKILMSNEPSYYRRHLV